MSKAWQQVSLGELLVKSDELVNVKPGKRYREVTVRLWGKGVVQRREVDGAEISAARRLVVRENQFILSRIDARNGAFGLVPNSLDGAVVSNDFPAFTLNSSRVNPSFLGWLSRTSNFVAICRAASEGTTNRVRLKEDRFLATEISLPPLSEQRRIVARIEELAAKIEDARGLRREAVEEAEALTKAFLDKEYNLNSCRFGVTPLDAVCKTITDGDHQTPSFVDTGVKFIFVGNVSSGHLHFDGCKYVTSDYFASIKSHRKPEKGDILYSAVGATLGIPAVVRFTEDFCFQRHVAIIKPDRHQLVSDFLYYMLRTATLFNKAWELTTGSAQPTVPLRAIRNLPIPVPPLPEQRRVVDYLDGLQEKVDSLKRIQKETADELDALLPSVLDKAFRGEL